MLGVACSFLWLSFVVCCLLFDVWSYLMLRVVVCFFCLRLVVVSCLMNVLRVVFCCVLLFVGAYCVMIVLCCLLRWRCSWFVVCCCILLSVVLCVGCCFGVCCV